jgi:hypothetical protein
MNALEGFWLPRNVRDLLLDSKTQYTQAAKLQGRPCSPDEPGSICACWPQFDRPSWKDLLEVLRENRQKAPRGLAFWERLQAALQVAARRLSDPGDPLHRRAMETVHVYTGYAPQMIEFTLGAFALMAPGQFPAAYRQNPNWTASRAWQPMPGLPGRVLFTPGATAANLLNSRLASMPGRPEQKLFSNPTEPELIVGYAAGNVPGAALLITMLSLGVSLLGQAPPVVLVRNSRSEPIFSPIVLSALEEADQELVSSVATLVWDHDDPTVQQFLAPQASLAIAAASDESISQIQSQYPTSVRFHAHGHKVSFSAVGSQALSPSMIEQQTGKPFVEVISLLSALDSVFWDQHGCLSARVHFIEQNRGSIRNAESYSEQLVEKLRLLQTFLPRGAWPRQPLFDTFDRYQALQIGGKVRVISNYTDPFVVLLDLRPPQANSFRELVNDCQGRVIAVRPVERLMDIPVQHLGLFSPRNLQSLSVVAGNPTGGLDDDFLYFASACARKGITAIRSLGRSAFPQLAYSWDGLLPLDLARLRPAGYFTTIEFDNPYTQISETFQSFLQHARGKNLL